MTSRRRVTAGDYIRTIVTHRVGFYEALDISAVSFLVRGTQVIYCVTHAHQDGTYVIGTCSAGFLWDWWRALSPLERERCWLRATIWYHTEKELLNTMALIGPPNEV